MLKDFIAGFIALFGFGIVNGVTDQPHAFLWILFGMSLVLLGAWLFTHGREMND